MLLHEPGAQELMEATTRRCQAMMADLLSELGARAYRVAGLRLARQAVAGLQAGLVEAQRAGGLQRWAATLQAGSATQRAWQQQWGSLALGVALRSGLAGADGSLHPDADLFLTVIVLYRWLQEAAHLKGVELPLRAPEEALLLRWKLERARPVVGPARREALRRLLELDPQYGPPTALQSAQGPRPGP